MIFIPPKPYTNIRRFYAWIGFLVCISIIIFAIAIITYYNFFIFLSNLY